MDDKFSNHVKSVFDEYEDGTADQGWVELLKKYPDRGMAAAKARRVIPMRLWLGAVAASVLVACLVLFFAQEQPADEVILVETEQPALPETNSGAVEKLTDGPVSEAGKRVALNESPVKQVGQRNAAPSGRTGTQNIATGITQNSATNADPARMDTYAGLEQKVAGQKPLAQQVQEEGTTPASNQSTAIASHTGTHPLEQGKKTQSMEEFLEQETKNTTALASNTKKSKSLTSFDIYAGTFLNYFENNPAKMNAGFGINANVKLARKVYLSVGAGVSENTIAYENSFPAESVAALTSSFPLNQPNSLKGGNPGASNSAVAPAGPNVTFASRTSGPSTDVSVNAVLLNLDVPIALKFYAGKNDRFYLLTGINSNSYINQRYIQSYSTFNYVSNTKETMEQEVEGTRLEGFDFANSAIFAVGVSQDLGKATTLTFEPFYRPSLRGLGDKNIRLNTIGVNLKLNVGRNK